MPPTTAATTVVEADRLAGPREDVRAMNEHATSSANPLRLEGQLDAHDIVSRRDESPAVRALVDICEARFALDQRERELVSVARSEGASWGAIADALDESRATIFRRHRAPDTVA
jgi:hypothetical protein